MGFKGCPVQLAQLVLQGKLVQQVRWEDRLEQLVQHQRSLGHKVSKDHAAALVQQGPLAL